MFLNEVALGKQHAIHNDDPSLRKPPKGFDSVLAQGHVEPGRSLTLCSTQFFILK